MGESSHAEAQSRHDQRILATEEMVHDILSEEVSPIKKLTSEDEKPLSEEQKVQLLSFADSAQVRTEQTIMDKLNEAGVNPVEETTSSMDRRNPDFTFINESEDTATKDLANLIGSGLLENNPDKEKFLKQVEKYQNFVDITAVSKTDLKKKGDKCLAVNNQRLREAQKVQIRENFDLNMENCENKLGGQRLRTDESPRISARKKANSPS